MTLDRRQVLLIGQGSTGRRHGEVLRTLGCDVATVSRRAGEGQFSSIEAALSESSSDVAVVATETVRHATDLAELARLKFAGLVLVEKPLVAWANELEGTRPSGPIFVGYNLRHHPVVQELRNALRADGGSPVAAQLHVGQALATWRPGRDSASVYSGYQAKGGGSLRDLSHELDLGLWLFGAGTRVASIGGRYTSQTVDSDDAWSILMTCERCPQVTVTLNAIDASPSRFIAVTTASANYRADLIEGTLSVGAERRVVASERNEGYRRMWQAVLSNDNGDLCGWTDGVAIVKLIATIEMANAECRWVGVSP